MCAWLAPHVFAKEQVRGDIGIRRMGVSMYGFIDKDRQAPPHRSLSGRAPPGAVAGGQPGRMLTEVTATRSVTPLREGGSLPGIVEAGDRLTGPELAPAHATRTAPRARCHG